MVKVSCALCPKGCVLAVGELGNCKGRVNSNGQIKSLAYGKPCSIAIDPMEKKPLYHFKPGAQVLSLGMAGCNLHCKNCQNSSISQSSMLELAYYNLGPKELVTLMKDRKISTVAYTYTEPLIAYEYIYDCAKAVKEAGLHNVLISAAYINKEPLEKLLPFIDAANIDLKSMNKDFYINNCNATLEPVLEAIKTIHKAGVCLEITNLLIPNLNDSANDIKALSEFICDELSDEIPLHFSRFYPTHKLTHIPKTSLSSLETAKNIAESYGLKYVYIGNTTETTKTICPNCKTELIERQQYNILKKALSKGLCSNCNYKIYGKLYEHNEHSVWNLVYSC